MRGWAKLQMLATQPEYSGKLRTYINNMQNAGEEDQAARNAFDMNAAKLAAQAEAYLKAGKFEAAPVNGKALNPNRDFIEKNLDKATVDALLAELDGGGKSFPPDSPRGLLAKNTMPALELAIRANPKWAEPHFKTAALESDACAEDRAAEDGRVRWLRATRSIGRRWLLRRPPPTCSRTPRNPGPPRSARPGARRRRRGFIRPSCSWKRTGPSSRPPRNGGSMEEEARDLQRVKDNAAAEIHAVEQAANQRMAANNGNVKGAVPWFGDPTGQKVSGTLTRVECLSGGPLRLTIQQAGFPIRLLIRNPKQLTVAADSGQAEFGCGVQKPARKIEVQHDGKADARLSTMGDILVVKFP